MVRFQSFVRFPNVFPNGLKQIVLFLGACQIAEKESCAVHAAAVVVVAALSVVVVPVPDVVVSELEQEEEHTFEQH